MTKKLGEKKFEIIVVNDAAKDRTTEKAMDFAMYEGEEIDLKVIEYEKNKGKGGAVRLGMMISRGEYALMVDADGATKFSDIEKILKEMKNTVNKKDQGFVAGSRKHLVKEDEVERTVLRSILSFFSTFVITVIVGI